MQRDQRKITLPDDIWEQVKTRAGELGLPAATWIRSIVTKEITDKRKDV